MMNIKIPASLSSPRKIAVIKFGASVLAKVEAIPAAVHEAYYYVRLGYRVLVVVSALGDTTIKLNQTVKILLDDDTIMPPANEFASLLAMGAISTACLFTIALDRAGIAAKKLDHYCLNTTGAILNATPTSLATDKLNRLFEQYSILVLPGFIGYDQRQNTTTILGSGGSDLTALFAAASLNANLCVLYKNTGGIYNQDPNIAENSAQRYAFLSLRDALKIPAAVIKHKALKFAQTKNLKFIVKGLACADETQVGTDQSVYAPVKPKINKLRIGLLGFGKVGFAIYKHLIVSDHLFAIAGIVTNNLTKNESKHLPPELIINDWTELLSRGCQVVMILIDDVSLAKTASQQAIIKGVHVITANTALMVQYGVELSKRTKNNKIKLLYSAAIAGAIPILENLCNEQQLPPPQQIQSITAVLNNTCNLILDKINQGKTLPEAVKLAKIVGINNGPLSLALNGLVDQQKMILIARAIFGKEPDSVEIIGIQYLDEQTIRATIADEKFIRLVACCELKNNKLSLQVRPICLDYNHPFAQISGDHNAIIIHKKNGEQLQFHGKSIGRWPIAEALYADLLALALPRFNFNMTAPRKNNKADNLC